MSRHGRFGKAGWGEARLGKARQGFIFTFGESNED
jgi:hypothetical protein